MLAWATALAGQGQGRGVSVIWPDSCRAQADHMVLRGQQHLPNLPYSKGIGSPAAAIRFLKVV